MIQASTAAHSQPLHQPDTRESDLLDPFWRLAGDLCNARALIVADHGLSLMCGLIRRGCLAATILVPGDKPDADNYDVVFVPLVTSADDVIRLACRALGTNGRLIAGAGDGKAAAALARCLRLNGFVVLRSIHLAGPVLLCAEPRRQS